MENELERLAILKAKGRVSNWKSPWILAIGAVVGIAIGLLPILWLGVSKGPIDVGSSVLATVVLGILGWFFYRRHKAWKRKEFERFYQEELLELNVKR